MCFGGNQHSQRYNKQTSNVSAKGAEQIVLKIGYVIDAVPVADAGLDGTASAAESQYCQHDQAKQEDNAPIENGCDQETGSHF